MPKEELLQFEGQVTEILPDARFRVQLDNGHQLVAYTAGRMKKNRIKTLAGDRVTVEVSPRLPGLRIATILPWAFCLLVNG
jgi:translation initiation factor IF-1